MHTFDHSLQGLRESLFARLDLSPNAASDTVTVANRFINTAIQRIALDHPYAFHEENVRVFTTPSYESFDATDTVSMTTDAFLIDGVESGMGDYFVLKRDTAVASIANTDHIWPSDRTLDGAFIELTLPNGMKHLNQIRTIWTDQAGSTTLGAGLVGTQYISLVKAFAPFYNVNIAGLGDESTLDDNIIDITYRIFHPYVWIPDDVVQVKSMHVMGDNVAPIEVMAQEQAETMGLSNMLNQNSEGTPRHAYRRGHFQLDAPTVAPSIAAHASENWQGPYPFGQFEFCFTWCWGKQDWDASLSGSPSYLHTFLTEKYNEREWDYNYDSTQLNTDAIWGANRIREPLFESAPSPISDAYTLADPGNGASADAITIEVPNLPFQLGYMFDLANRTGSTNEQRTKISATHSGLFARVYMRAVSHDIGAGYTSLGSTVVGSKLGGLSMLEVDDNFRLLAEFKPTTDNDGKLTWNGNLIPDHLRKLRDVHGYQAMALHPLPDDRYAIDMRVVKRPPPLVDDTDHPQIDPVACECIVTYAASLFCERLKDVMGAERYLKLYRDSSRVISRRYGDLRSVDKPVTRVPANMRRGAFRTGLRAT